MFREPGVVGRGPPLLAQTYHGGLRGAVREPGGVIPGANVTLANQATKLGRSTVTNNLGEYAFINVEPGTYTVKVSLQRFKPIESTGVRIGTQQFLTLDFTLELGGLHEAITVESATSPLETSNASVGSTLDKDTLQILPTAGRNPFMLSVTTPNVVHTFDPQFVRQQDQNGTSLLSLGGGPRAANNFTLDGVSITDLRNRATFIPSIEAVEEVKVQISTYDAEMGRTGGGVFNTTAKSGTNEWHGSLLYQNRPQWGAGQLYFEKQAGTPKADTYFHLYAGSLGGPIVKDKTFLFATTEGYRTKTTRNSVLTVPTDRELNGDFSASGVTIFDPLTTRPAPGGGYVRDPFPGNLIPPDRINPVARALRQYWPAQGGSATAELVDKADQATLKLDQRWSERVHSSLMYAWYRSEEPEARFLGLGDNPADPSGGLLFRSVHVVASNNTITPDPNTVAHVRLGYTTFEDDSVANAFDPATLGFSPQFIGEMPREKFPSFDIGSWGSDYNPNTFGDRFWTDNKFYSWDANASISRLFGRHTLKLGASYRRLGLRNTPWGPSSGSFVFSGGFSNGPDPVSARRARAHELADFLLGFPSSGQIQAATPNDFLVNYYAGFIQDDFRVGKDLTVNFGLRYEFEQGLREQNDAFTVGFDRERPWPFQIPPERQVPGLPVILRGGLMYAGVDGYPAHQSNPSKTKFAPRVGFAWSVDPRSVVRGGYGIFYSPSPFLGPPSQATRGFTANTTYVASNDGGLTPCATCGIVNPFPFGIEQPRGSADGILTGGGGAVDFVDQFRQSPYVHQFSLDLQRELPGEVVLGVAYIGARSERLSIGGIPSITININQLDPRYQALGTSLLDPVPNPMFGDTRFGAFGRQPTITRGQLLRPYPQFGDLRAAQVSAGRARYHSAVLRLDRRIKNGWGARANYAWSSNEDNLVGEANFFSQRSPLPLDNYDLDAEFGTSLLHVPHRLNLSATVELPFGKGRRWLSEPSVLRALFGGWSVTVVGAYHSGFPVSVSQSPNNSNLLGNGQRPNLTGVDPKTPGSTEERLDNWLSRSAWSSAAAYTSGNAPRTDTRVRTPFKSNTDIAFQKVEPLGGSKRLMVRLELINAFDDPNFVGPNTTFGAPDFGRILTVAGFPRTLQVMVRLGL